MKSKSITISTLDLKSALAGFNKILNKRSTLPVLGAVLIESNKNGQLQLAATNLDDYVFRNVPANGPAEFKALVPFSDLQKVANACAGEDSLTLEQEGESCLAKYTIAGTAFSEMMTSLPVEDYPGLPSCQWTDPVSVGDEFKQAIREAFDSASTDESRHLINHAFVDVSDPAAHYVVATTGHEMYIANSFHLRLPRSIIVPKRSFLLWKGFYADGDWNISLETDLRDDQKKPERPGWIKISSDNWTLVTRRIDGEYPHWRGPVPSGERTSCAVFDDAAKAFMLKAAPRLPGNEDQSAPVTLLGTGGGSLVLHARSSVHHASIPVAGTIVEGEGFSRTINRNRLVKAIRLGLDRLEVFGDDIGVVFTNGRKRLVVARLKDDSDAPAPTEASTPNTNPAPMPESKPEEKKERMKPANRIENVTTETANTSNQPQASAFDQIRAQLEKLRDFHRSAVADINESLKMLAQAQRDRKATEKEIEEVRETLQSLQKIRI